MGLRRVVPTSVRLKHLVVTVPPRVARRFVLPKRRAVMAPPRVAQRYVQLRRTAVTVLLLVALKFVRRRLTHAPTRQPRIQIAVALT